MAYNYEDFSELVHKRRSVRKLKPDPIPEGSAEKILECGRWAMSGGNAQPWEFIVIQDADTKRKMAELWTECAREYKYLELTRTPEIRHPLFSRSFDEPPNWKNAPLLIGVIGDRRKMQISVLHPGFYGAEGGDGINATFYKDLGCAAQVMHLAACSLGLASHWLSIERDLEQKYKRLLGIPDDLELHSLVVVGYPAYEPPAGYRRDLKDFVHYERYDDKLYSSTKDLLEQILASRNAVRAQESAAYTLSDGDR
ncbi:MAG: nitroreductase family protein [Clostridiales Family XIII bacterium]|nr:nitroreductase family protein [Clostridiales Family XIII bacterium]